MVKIDITYTGDLHCEATHGPSGSTLQTDAPKDNQGKGEAFSPTDLCATALGTCITTIMGIRAREKDIDLRGMKVAVEKHMVADPVRRIGRLALAFTMPHAYPADQRKLLEEAAGACPVCKSIHPDTKVELTFNYPDE